MIRLLTSTESPPWPSDKEGSAWLKAAKVIAGLVGFYWFLGSVGAFISILGD